MRARSPLASVLSAPLDSTAHLTHTDAVGEMQVLPRPTLFDFHGVSMTKYFTDNWENIQNFQARPDDILIATYPKAGTTWVSYIVDLLYFGKTFPERQTTITLQERVPFLELFTPPLFSGVDMADKLPTTPRLIKTHLPFQFVPKSFLEQNCRIIYVARNAKDNAVSYFHFNRMNSVQPEANDWSLFLQDFLDGKMVFGSWFDHVNGWWEKKQTHAKLLYLFYEDLVEDCGRELEKMSSFLGLSPSAEERQSILTGVSFDSMKKNEMTNFSSVPLMDQKVSPFMRKGKVGDWRNHFSEAQDKHFNEVYKQKMRNPALQFRTDL